MLRAIIFDCFGVLYPSGSNSFYDNHKESFKNGSRILDEVNLKIDLGEITRQQYFAALAAATGIPASQVEQEYRGDEHEPDNNLVELIKRLKSRYKIGLLSNTSEEEISMIYHHGIDKLFDVLTLSYQVKAVKPDPTIFRVCLEALDVEPHEALFIDDSQTHVMAAEKIGIRGLPYPRFGVIPETLAKLS